jgi:hypothetical protein
MAITQSDLDVAYAQGQSDGVANKYNPPINFWKSATGFANEDELELKVAYDKGYELGRAQR